MVGNVYGGQVDPNDTTFVGSGVGHITCSCSLHRYRGECFEWSGIRQLLCVPLKHRCNVAASPIVVVVRHGKMPRIVNVRSRMQARERLNRVAKMK